MKFVVNSGVLVEVIQESEDSEVVTIPKGITALENALFSEDKTIKSVVLPDTVTRIGREAFRESSIDTVIITSQQSLTIEALAFCQSSVRRIQILHPLESLTLGESCFSFCEGLERLDLLADRVSIGEKCFECCIRLSELGFNASTDEIESHFVEFHSRSLFHSKVTKLDLSEYYGIVFHEKVADSRRLTLLIESLKSPQQIKTDSINEVVIKSCDGSKSFKFLPEDLVTPLRYVVSNRDVLVSIVKNLSVSGLFHYNKTEFYLSRFMSLETRQLILLAVLEGRNIDETFVFVKTIMEFKNSQKKEFLLSVLDMTIYFHLKKSIANDCKQYEYQIFNSYKDLLIQKSLYTDLEVFMRFVNDGIITELDCSLVEKYMRRVGLGEAFTRWFNSGELLIKFREFLNKTNTGKFSVYNQRLMFYEGKDSSVQVPSDVSVIARGAFSGNKSIKKVTLPKSVIRIEEKAFASCSVEEVVCYSKSLIVESKCFDQSSLRIFRFEGTESVTLGEYAFANCFVQRIRLPSMKELPKGCFSSCDELSEVELPTSLELIGENCFQGCVSLSVIKFPVFLTKIGRDAFNGCLSLKEVALPEVHYCMEAFGNTGIMELSMPQSLRLLSSTTFKVPREGCVIRFKGNKQLKSVEVDKICVFESDNLKFPVTLLPLSVLGEHGECYQHLKEILFSEESFEVSTVEKELSRFFAQFSENSSRHKELAVFLVQFFSRKLKFSDDKLVSKLGEFILNNESQLLDQIFLCYPKVKANLLMKFSESVDTLKECVVTLGDEESTEEFEFASGLF